MTTTPHAFALFIEHEIRKAFHKADTPRNELRYDADTISSGKLFEAMCCLLEFHHADKAEIKEFKKKYSSIQGKHLHELKDLKEIEFQFKGILRSLAEQ